MVDEVFWDGIEICSGRDESPNKGDGIFDGSLFPAMIGVAKERGATERFVYEYMPGIL